MYDDFATMRDTFQELADMCDNLVKLEAREKAGEDVQKELEAQTGLFVYKLMLLQSK